jgi:hypothetical protein
MAASVGGDVHLAYCALPQPTVMSSRATRPPADTPPERRSVWQRALAVIVPDANPAGQVFGLIALGALLAAESARHETYLEVVGTSMLALTLYWFAHAYGEIVGERMRSGARLSGQAVRRALVHDWPIMRGASAPLLAVLVCWVAGADTNTAVLAALWTCVGCLVAFELIAGLQAGAGPLELLIEGSIGAAMGIAILLLKIILR